MNRAASIVVLASLLGRAVCPAGEAPARQPDAFEQLLAKVQADPRRAPEEQVKQLLSMAAQRGQCHAVSLAVKSHLAHNFRAAPELLRLAAEISVLAGDFRTAAARYKSYLAANPNGPQAQEAAAALYRLLADFLDADDDAYQFIRARGETFRGSAEARKFDSWFVEQARRRGDGAAMAKALHLVLSSKLPLEQERLHFWESLDWLMSEIVRGQQQHFDALPTCRKLVPLVRGDKRRSLRYALCVAALAFRAGSAGKDDAALDAAYGSVVAAAKAYLEAYPTAATLKEIVWVLADGGVGRRFDDAAWARRNGPKSRFFVHAFDKLDDAGRQAILEWRLPDGSFVARRLASREQWAELGARHRQLLRRSPAVRHLPFVTQAPTRDAYRKQAEFLQGVPSRDAAAIGALAASDDLAKCVDHLVANDAWHLGPHDVWRLIDNTLWPAHRAIRTKAGKPPPETERLQAIVHFGANYLSKSPAALDPQASRSYIDAAWSLLPNEQKGKMVDHLRRLQWVPYRRRDRAEIFGHTLGAVRTWAGWVRRELQRKQSKLNPEVAKQIAPVQAAFRTAMDPDAADPTLAPNPLCKALALAIAAEEKPDAEAFVEQARALYPMVRDYRAKKIPFGHSVLEYILTNRLDRFDTIDFQLEVVRDQLARLGDREPDDSLRAICDTVVRTGDGHSWWGTPKEARERTLKLNALFEQALLARLAKGRFSPTLFDWFRGTRSGNQWRDQARGEAVMAKVIETRALHKTDYRPYPSIPSATVSYMRLVVAEFPGLNATYPVARYFDDMFVEEAKQTGRLDGRYWDYGRDEKKKVADTAATVLQRHQKLPFDYNDPEPAYARGDYWSWQARALGAGKAARDALIAAAEKTHGRTRFDTLAMGRAYFSAQADASTLPGRKAFFARLKAYLERVRNAPVRLSPPYLGQLRAFGKKEVAAEELDVLLSIFPACTPTRWPRGWHFDTLARVVARGLVAHHREVELYRVLPHLWKIARDTHSTELLRELTRLAADLADREQHDLALVCSVVGLAMAKAELPEDARSSLVAVRSKSLSNIGGVIPVKRDDPRYPIYAAQAAYLGGMQQSAWELYLSRQPVLGGMVKELDPAFCIWLIDKHTEVRDFAAAEALARKMIQWFDSVADGFQPETRARLLLSYASIALARREFPRARALFERVAAAQEFQDTPAQGDAELKVAEVDRLTGRFDESAKRLERLARSKDTSLQAESYYGLALVSFDQEEYREALDHLEQVFARVPDHANAKILEARSKVKMRKLEEATEIQIGTVTRRRFLVPGKPLRVNLEDRNLAVVGTSTDVEIRAWAESGDEETFSLMPFGESTTRFRGSLPTALAPVAKGDRTLQVLGNDVVHYDFSERFKRRHKIALRRPETLVVTTDAELLVSSGKILSKAEREARALEELIRRRLGEDRQTEQQVALSTVRREEQIKPGNRFNVRVVDPDRSETADRDTLTVRVAAASGDAIAAFTLTETDTHSGVFEGAVPTASGHAVAFASDSDDGKEPNFVISGKDYPAWVALPDNQRPKTFGVDLNDNVALGRMTVAANVPGRKLKSFLVQTSLNAQDFATVASWPQAFQPWDGSPRMELVRYGKHNQAPGDVAAFRKYLDEDYLREGTPKFHRNDAVLAGRFDEGVAGLADKIGLADEGEGSWYIVHHYAAFYQPARRRRSFDVEAEGLDEEPRRGGGPRTQYILTIDGEVGDTPTNIRRSLGKGVHRIDLYLCATRKAQPQYRVRMDVDEAPFMATCPAAMLDVRQHPQIRAGIYREPAKVTAADEGGTFDIAFAQGTRARVVRLLMVDFETDAPAIGKITLTDAAGKAVLPAQEDFTALRANQVLEIIPGDRVAVSYEDPRVITQGEEHHEAFLTATFSNATVSACFVEYSIDGAGERQARYIPMRRFKPGDRINVFVHDPDCDVSDQRDTVTFTARTSEGKPREFPALETEEHSGVFVGGVFPVEGAPKRESEVQVVEGDDVIVTYVDQENTDPGIPWNRPCVVEQTWYEPPEIRVYSVQSQPLEQQAKTPAGPAAAKAPPLEELVPVTRSLVVTWPEKHEPEKPTPVLINGPLVVEVVFPYIAQSPESAAILYVQAAAGRKAHAAGEPEGAFDIQAPGTIKLQARPSNVPRLEPPPGYKEVLVRGNPFAADALDDGRFTFSVPMALAALPDRSLVDEEPEDPQEQPALAIKGNDEIFIGFEFADGQGRKTWATRRVALDADSFFDAMDRRYREPLTGVYVGESIYFRVIDPTRDTTDKKDPIAVPIAATSGATRELTLTETFTHSGIFKGHVKIVYKGEAAAAKAPDELPCQYGDTVTATYKRPQAKAGIERKLTVHKGSDGIVVPFTKRFADPAIAVQTQFTIAEAYFEMAKRHRALGHDELARREIAQGKKLLEEAVRDYPDTEARAQADYLLAELALEFANDAQSEEARRKHYAEAVGRFADIVAAYPDSPYAPKAQYKKALVFEKMGQIDQACEEYVKLSYRYPDNELVAETIARLGQYFLTKGKALRKEAEDVADRVEAEKREMQAADMHRTAAQVFGRLAVRFPSHRLAGKTSVLSAQCYMQARDLAKAAEVFQAIIKTPKMGNDLVAESMYWCGDCYMRQRDYVSAYRTLKKLTWDYPASTWAKFARGRLSEEALTRAAKTGEDDK